MHFDRESRLCAELSIFKNRLKLHRLKVVSVVLVWPTVREKVIHTYTTTYTTTYT